MLEVVFNDSVKGAMRHAKKDVVYIGFCLDIGNVSVAIDDPIRRDVFSRMWGRFNFSIQKENDFFKSQRYDYDRLLNVASSGLPIRIWRSDAPYSTCGFYYVCDVLRNIECEINVVSLPKHRCISDNKIQELSEWNEVDEIDDFLEYAVQVSENEKKMYSNYWKNMVYDNGDLRAIVNGKLISVHESHYDFLITDTIPDGEFLMARLIGDVLMKYPIGVKDTWYASRIEHLIELGDLEIIRDEDNSHPYGKVLKCSMG